MTTMDNPVFERIKREHGELKDLLSQLRSTISDQQPDAQQAQQAGERQPAGSDLERSRMHDRNLIARRVPIASTALL